MVRRKLAATLLLIGIAAAQSQFGQRPDYRDQNQQNYPNQQNRDNQNQNQQNFSNQQNRDQNFSNQQQNRDQNYPNSQNRDQNYPNQQNRDQNYPNQQNRDQNSQQFGNNNHLKDDNCCEEYCYYNDEEPYIHFATKTAYESINSRRTGQQHLIPDCQPVQFWSLNRHGTRLPSQSKIESLHKLTNLQEQIMQNYEQRRSYPTRGKLCPEDYNLFRRWRWNDTITVAKANSLASQGIEELRLLARRYKAKFPAIFQEPYSENAFSFQYTDSDRTHDSYQAFIEGLFQADAYKVHANVLSDEMLIKPSESCKAWRERVDQNPQTFNEYERFTQRQEYKQMTRDVLTRLGFRFALNTSIINDIYDMCRYEKAWNVEHRSAWCIAFTKEHLKLLEYAEDLKYYYKFGYGNDINKELGCATVKDLYDRFEKTVNGNNDGNKASFFFAHSAAIQTTLTAMGFAKDQNPLTADNYYSQSRRQWRTSTIDPFASNLAAILYQCRSGERNKVMFFLNESPVELPDCSVGLCDWSTIQKKFRYAAENCHLDSVCNGNSANSFKQPHYFIQLAFATFVVIYFSIRQI